MGSSHGYTPAAPRPPEMTPRDLLEYEISGAWWSGFIGWFWLQDLVARFFAWRVNVKWKRYQKFRLNVYMRTLDERARMAVTRYTGPNGEEVTVTHPSR